MNIALVGKSHYCIMGFLLEALKSHTITLYSTNTDIFKDIDYYHSVYNFKIEDISTLNIKNFDRVIKLTNTDDCLHTEDVLSVLHLQSHIHVNNKSKQFISLTPYITGSNISYMFPIFKPKRSLFASNVVVHIGYYLNRFMDADTDLFVKNNLNYTFIFFVWGDNDYSQLQKHPNVQVLMGVDTTQVMDVLSKAKYSLSRKYVNYDRFSAQLGLAMSHKKPIILDSKTAASYALPGLIFDKNYTEIGKLDDVSDERYMSLVNDIEVFNNASLKNNYERMDTLLETA